MNSVQCAQRLGWEQGAAGLQVQVYIYICTEHAEDRRAVRRCHPQGVQPLGAAVSRPAEPEPQAIGAFAALALPRAPYSVILCAACSLRSWVTRDSGRTAHTRLPGSQAWRIERGGWTGEDGTGRPRGPHRPRIRAGHQPLVRLRSDPTDVAMPDPRHELDSATQPLPGAASSGIRLDRYFSYLVMSLSFFSVFLFSFPPAPCLRSVDIHSSLTRMCWLAGLRNDNISTAGSAQ